MKHRSFILFASFVLVLTFTITEEVFSEVNQSVENSDYVKGITISRAASLAEGVLGLISIIIGWRAKSRSLKTLAKTALALGFVAIIISVAHLTATVGAVFGSGSGKAGAILALVLGIIGCIFGGLTLIPRNTKR